MPGTTSQRWRSLSDQLTVTIDGVPAGAWDNPSPCEEWDARDVVRHLVDWMPGLYLSSVNRPPLDGPSVDDDPAAAWKAADDAIQRMLDDPNVADRMTHTRAGEMTLEQLVAMTGLSDLLIHRWDLARATGQDETMDAGEVRAYLDGIEPWMSEVMVSSGFYKAPVELPDGADDQSRLLAFNGRRP